MKEPRESENEAVNEMSPAESKPESRVVDSAPRDSFRTEVVLNFTVTNGSDLPVEQSPHLLPQPTYSPVVKMMSQTLRASRSLFTRASRQQVPVARTFLTSAVRRADPVQDLYLRELKAYKPTPIKAGDADAHVQKFALPQAPASPEEANLAGELSAYESQVVEVEGQAAAGEAAPVEESWFEEDEEETPAAH
ncbi:hypothetical protein N7540_003875 [Penicillium herquei]|nr:hypothetical protein N7540_003875 [Penicillium herquei]